MNQLFSENMSYVVDLRWSFLLFPLAPFLPNTWKLGHGRSKTRRRRHFGNWVSSIHTTTDHHRPRFPHFKHNIDIIKLLHVHWFSKLRQLSTSIRNNFKAMESLLSSLRQQYDIENIIIIDDPAQLPTASPSKKPTQQVFSIMEASDDVDVLVSSVCDDMARLIKWGGKSSRRSKQSIKQCRWSGSNSVMIHHPRNRLSTAPTNIKKDVSPTRPTRR